MKRGKLDETVEKGIFMGYAIESKGYKIYNLKEAKIQISRDVDFDEDACWNLELMDVDQRNTTDLISAVGRKIDEDKTDVDVTSDSVVLKVKSLANVYERCNLVHAEPTSYTNATRFPVWVEAMKLEIESIERNQTWSLIVLPHDKKEIGVKWQKGGLVVKGLTQVVGIDYGDTFAPVARHDTIRLLLALAAQLGWESEGFEIAGNEHQVYKLHKAFYGLKQAPRAWYSRIDAHLIQLGFKRSENEATLYLKQDENGLQLVISLYVDDMLVTGSNIKLLAEFKREMDNVFDMSDLGVMNYFLGMEIHQSSSGIFLSQRKYVVDEVATPLALNEKVSKNDGEKLEDPSAYRCIVGSLLYLTATRPDLMFPAGLLSRFMSSPSNVHMGIAKRVPKYIKGTSDLDIGYSKAGGVDLIGYANSD
uniref:Reverse transcriptase Ty1/copia-type domain-containing protein n=1 Tax=Salix viminalis TaxID=40686 RepID=A0A6N2MMZ3_SALVM